MKDGNQPTIRKYIVRNVDGDDDHQASASEHGETLSGTHPDDSVYGLIRISVNRYSPRRPVTTQYLGSPDLHFLEDRLAHVRHVDAFVAAFAQAFEMTCNELLGESAGMSQRGWMALSDVWQILAPLEPQRRGSRGARLKRFNVRQVFLPTIDRTKSL